MTYEQDKAIDVLESDSLLEVLASLEHERWSHWQGYLHAQCTTREDGSLIIPAELARRWSVQMASAYDELSEQEKESDREQVRRYLPVIASAIRAA
jgi:hypothetical protein